MSKTTIALIWYAYAGALLAARRFGGQSVDHWPEIAFLCGTMWATA